VPAAQDCDCDVGANKLTQAVDDNEPEGEEVPEGHPVIDVPPVQ